MSSPYQILAEWGTDLDDMRILELQILEHPESYDPPPPPTVRGREACRAALRVEIPDGPRPDHRDRDDH